MSNDLKSFVSDSRIGLELEQIESILTMRPLYALYDTHCREVFRGNFTEIIAFINGCKYIRDLYEPH